jgi:hypothetical protein
MTALPVPDYGRGHGQRRSRGFQDHDNGRLSVAMRRPELMGQGLIDGGSPSQVVRPP